MAGTTSWASATTGTTPTLPATLTLTQLLRFTGQRIPVGLDITRSPGPYRAAWNDRTKVVATTYDGGLVSAAGSGDLVLTLTGGGLTSERVLTVSEPGVATSWHVPASYTAGVESGIAEAQTARGDRTLWKYWLPGFLVVLAGWLGLTGLRGMRARRAAPPPAPGGDGAPDAPPADAGRTGRKHHVSTPG
jgi:high-affinity iron transporter